ncbi:hypothetical protein [Rugamonas apoptosis]|uniref:Uncharacterized protein n=1 Tax=Rugamonas apoptosis TaxID=2758570 RepID=A0A7W2IMT7_9BURK|nr:hypothetical protein [Rugamonas apoptosis]MBA5690033.1 hypothetical protein [Rugamonas apoptosis]
MEENEVEKGVMKMYRESEPDINTLYEYSYINHIAWSTLLIAIGLIVWLTIALSNAENQRNALINRQCADPVFKGEIDTKCLKTVHSREHWWQHVAYALRHVKPE